MQALRGKDGKFPHYQLTRKVDGKLLQCKATTGPDDIQLVDAATVVTGPVDGNPMSDGGPVGGPVDGGSVGGGPTDGGQVDVPTSDTGG